jgi:hypothetical protein
MRRRVEGRMLLIPGLTALLACALVVAGVATSSSVPAAPLAGDHATVQIAVTAPAGTSTRVEAVALGATKSGLRADPGVLSVAAAKAAGRETAIRVTLASDDAHSAAGVIRRIQAGVDPGPLQLSYTAAALTLDRAQSSVRGQLAKLELLVAPLVLLCIFALLGSSGGWTALIAATMGAGGALLVIRLSGGYLFAIAPAVAIAIAQATELAGLHVALTREESPAGAAAVPERVLRRWLPAAGAATAIRGIGPFALLATSFDGAWSIGVASLVAAALAFATVLVVAPSVAALTRRGRSPGEDESRLTQAAHAVPGALARSRLRLGGVVGAAVLVGLVLVLPVRDAAASPLAAAGQAAGSVVDGLGVAAVLFGLGVAAGLALGRRPAARLRLAPTAVLALLPAAATAGVLVFAVQDGNLPVLAGARPALAGGSLAACLAAVAAIAGGRCVLAAITARDAGGPEVGSRGAADLAAALTVRGALASTAALVGCFGVLCAADLGAAREVGLGIAAGALLDLVLARGPFLGILARWGH